MTKREMMLIVDGVIERHHENLKKELSKEEMLNEESCLLRVLDIAIGLGLYEEHLRQEYEERIAHGY